MIEQQTRYGMRTTVALQFNDALALTKKALSTEGFGVLCEIDVAATMKNKLDVKMKPYVILGACNPPLAYRALTAEPDIGLLLPCNVVVYAEHDTDQIIVAAIDPVEALDLTSNEDIRPIAEQVRARLVKVLESVAAELPA